jgi:hypothetical protein
MTISITVFFVVVVTALSAIGFYIFVEALLGAGSQQLAHRPSGSAKGVGNDLTTAIRSGARRK